MKAIFIPQDTADPVVLVNSTITRPGRLPRQREAHLINPGGYLYSHGPGENVALNQRATDLVAIHRLDEHQDKVRWGPFFGQ